MNETIKASLSSLLRLDIVVDDGYSSTKLIACSVDALLLYSVEVYNKNFGDRIYENNVRFFIAINITSYYILR